MWLSTETATALIPRTQLGTAGGYWIACLSASCGCTDLLGMNSHVPAPRFTNEGKLGDLFPDVLLRETAYVDSEDGTWRCVCVCVCVCVCARACVGVGVWEWVFTSIPLQRNPLCVGHTAEWSATPV